MLLNFSKISSNWFSSNESQKIHDLLKVMALNGIEHDEIYLLHINPNYERGETLNVFECLMIGDEFYNDRCKKCGSIMDHVNACERDLDDIIDRITSLGDMSDVKKVRSSICTAHYKCEYFNECFPEFHDTSIMNLVQSSKKYDCLEMGIDDMAQVMGDEIEANRMQYAQVMAAKKQGLFVDKFALMGWLSKITYPITYLDFEWQTYVYPPYEKMKPFDVLVFQYSMHIEDENGELSHEQYIGKGDCRVEFIEDLISKIPETGTILVFNAQGAEALRLQQLAKQYPQYEEKLRSIWERMLDLSLPFSCGLIYDVRMAGEYNLKKLLSLFSDLSYDELEINQGLLAVKKYRELESEESEEREDIELITLPEEKRKDTNARKEALNSADIAFLCLPDAAAIEAVSLIDNENTVVIDTSTAHRTNDGWAYGFPELSEEFENKLKNSKRIAVPGCYASGFIALVKPLVDAGIVDKDICIACHAMSGYSGAGKNGIAQYEDENRDTILDAPREYALTQQHKHLKEMKAISGLNNEPIFSPYICDYFSGMVMTVPLFKKDLKNGKTAEDIKALYKEKYNSDIVKYKESIVITTATLRVRSIAPATFFLSLSISFAPKLLAIGMAKPCVSPLIKPIIRLDTTAVAPIAARASGPTYSLTILESTKLYNC